MRLKVASIIGAGSIENRPIRPGETCRIMTGAWLPEGSVAVIKQEDVEITNENYRIVSVRPRLGENIRRSGHELRAGDRVAAKGQVLKAEILERIAACGIERVPVCKVPRVYIIDTGNELLLPGSPSNRMHILQQPEPDSMQNSQQQSFPIAVAFRN